MASFREVVRAELMEMQQGRCAVCPSEGPLIVDHDHETGLVRGLLCRGCNSREGKCLSREFHVVPDAAMLAYLADPPAAGKGWLWAYPDPRRNPARMEADYQAVWALAAKIDLPVPGEPRKPPAQVSAAEDRPAHVVEVAAEPIVEPAPKPKRRRPPAAPVSIEEAIAQLQLLDLPPLPATPGHVARMRQRSHRGR